MKELKIDKRIEAQVEQMFLLGKQMGDLAKNYPSCLRIIKEQFGLTDYSSNNFEDSVDNLKVRLYAEIIRQDNRIKKLKEEKIKKELQQQSRH